MVFSRRAIVIVLLLPLPAKVFTHCNYEEAAPHPWLTKHLTTEENIPQLDRELRWRMPHSRSANFKRWQPLTNQSVSQWQSLGPEGGHITSLAMHPDDPHTIYASSYTYPCLIHTTTNGGETWRFMSTVDGWVNCLAVNPAMSSVLYASTWGEYLYVSTDAGLSWTAHRTNTDNNYIYAIALHPKNPNVIWGAGDVYEDNNFFMGVGQSIDGGSTWSFIPLSKVGWGTGSSVAVDPADSNAVYVGGYCYDGSYIPHPKLFKTADGGLCWADISSYIDTLGATGYVYTVMIDPANSQNLYAGGHYWDENRNEFYLLKSTDGGSHWTPIGSGITSPVYSLVIDASLPSTLYASTYDEVVKSLNGGLSWNPTGGGIVGKYVRSLLLDTVFPSTLYAGNRAGAFRTTDGGQNWLPSSSGMVATRICALAIAYSSPNTIYVGVESDALYKSTDDGNGWTRLQEFSGCHGVEALAVDPQDANKIYLFTGG